MRDSDSRADLLAQLRDRMEQTKALYEGAKAEFELARARMDELGATHPDGSLAHAAKVYNFTLTSYHTALREYNELLLRGHAPKRSEPE